MLRSLLTVALVAGRVWSYDQLLGFNGKLIKETRPIEEIYKAALAEGGRCSQWMGGDEKVRCSQMRNTIFLLASG